MVTDAMTRGTAEDTKSSEHFSPVGGGGREGPARLLRGCFEVSAAGWVAKGKSEHGER